MYTYSSCRSIGNPIHIRKQNQWYSVIKTEKLSMSANVKNFGSSKKVFGPIIGLFEGPPDPFLASCELKDEVGHPLAAEVSNRTISLLQERGHRKIYYIC